MNDTPPIPGPTDDPLAAARRALADFAQEAERVFRSLKDQIGELSPPGASRPGVSSVWSGGKPRPDQIDAMMTKAVGTPELRDIKNDVGEILNAVKSLAATMATAQQGGS